MMDVDKLQRINNLARELMKHGMVNSMDEAVRMAEEKIKGNAEVSSIKTTMSSDTLSQSQVSASAARPGPQPDVQGSIEIKKMQSMINEQAQLISAMSGKINELVSEFNKLQQEINRLKTIQVPSQASADKKDHGTQAQLRPQPADKKDPHARSGNYRPEDVSIEKIFYTGVR